ncbi:hypothetical protein ACDL65_12855 [Corynebacterium belfantii]|uniref:hypothetical protein n=1 Tax=Corynebacterium belfantii TaxID=2014537 RepID=UPI0018D46125|nr:hypothetical protein [Corynebacterium belfantii]MBG9334530.1 hypothetical protein [Corynebacterium belfantii]
MAITAVAIPFNPGIPWVTWAGAFLLLFFAAELVSMFIKTGGVEGEGKKTQAVLCFSAAAALILILLLVIFFD